MYSRVEKEKAREILKIIGYVISLNKRYFKAKDLTNMLGIKSKGRHKLSHSLETLVSHKLVEIYYKNNRNLYHIPVQKRLLDAYYECLWNYVQDRSIDLGLYCTSTMRCRRESKDYNKHNNKPFPPSFSILS